VPIVFVGRMFEGRQQEAKTLSMLADEAPLGALVDVAPTLLKLFGLTIPSHMSGSNLL
jgi:bisphosphoglycerate-independent phosphoglycerate mutase (AlkP superfamily)